MEYLTRSDDGAIFVDEKLSRQIAEIEKQAKAIAEAQKEMKKILCEEMRSCGIKKIETEDITLTYIDETETEYFDKKQFRADNPDLFDNYVSMNPKSAYVKVGVK